MKRTLLIPDPARFPQEFQPLLTRFPVYDSSCSAAARVYLIDGMGGLYLKSAPAGSLKAEAEMTHYFHGKGLGAQVLAYLPKEQDWLLTRRIPGEDCTHPDCLRDPRRLCDTTGQILRRLHETDFSHCPVTNRNAIYRSTAQAGFQEGKFEQELFASVFDFSSPEEAWKEAEENGKYLRSDVLLHGDYCLPNTLLQDWRFSGFIDLGDAGVGDRHIDLLWGAWTLNFNLHTNAYFDRFLDAYGRDKVQPELLRTVAAMEVLR